MQGISYLSAGKELSLPIMATGENSNTACFGYFGKDLSIKILFTPCKGHLKYLTSGNILV
jgi:hypothetical protein